MPYRFEKTEDVAIIKAVMAHPSLYRHLHDDFAPERDQWEPLVGHPMVRYYAVYYDSELIGILMTNQHSAICVEIHSCFLPKAWGKHVRAAAIEFREWIWANTSIVRIIGKVVASNRASLRYAEAVGFKVFGIDEKSKMVGGKLQDQVYFGMSKP